MGRGRKGGRVREGGTEGGWDGGTDGGREGWREEKGVWEEMGTITVVLFLKDYKPFHRTSWLPGGKSPLVCKTSSHPTT